MDTATYSLHDLSEATGIEARTIRSYIQLGLLRGPDGAGRAASYGPYHLERLKAIVVLKDLDGLSLSEIRRRFLAASEDEVSTAAARFAGRPASFGKDDGRDSTLAYVRQLRRKWAHGKDRLRARYSMGNGFKEEQPPLAAPERGVVPTAYALPSPEKEPIERTRRLPAEEWVRFTVTPDVELHIRGPVDVERRGFFERLAVRIRALVLGGRDE
ncbi:MAG: MerR family transcriptional regulator [Alphaproteobacteria bacterium]|nr:MerR family transcriptional regulator [Alphaproteobacteria bacterium]